MVHHATEQNPGAQELRALFLFNIKTSSMAGEKEYLHRSIFSFRVKVSSPKGMCTEDSTSRCQQMARTTH